MNELVNQVQSGSFDPIKLLNEGTSEISEVKAAIKSLTSTLPKDKCIDVFVTNVVPAVFAKNVDNWIRDELIELGSHFLQFVNASMLGAKEQEEILTAVDNTYIKVVGELRDSNYANWDQLWVFLIKLSNEKLHSRQSTTNKLLKEVEVAFRNSSSTEQRLKAYDCWKELINNSSLNMEYMCSAKQLKLLVTPMKAKFSRTPTVIVKRCDTYIYLLEKLQDQATLCLREFLEFCFEPFDEKNDSERTRQGRSVPEVCCKSTKVLLEIIGHSHDPVVKCLKSDEFQLFKPLITNENFHSFAEILINSVMECCTLLHHCKQDKIINGVMIQCLWQSLLRLIHQSSDDVKKKCCAQINSSLNKVLRNSVQNEFYYLVLGNIVELLVRDKLLEEFRDIAFAISIHLLWMINFQTCTFLEFYILKFVNSCLDSDSSSKFHKLVWNYFKNNSECKNPNQLSSVWCKCNLSVTSENLRSLMWPVRYLHELKDAKGITSKWVKIFVGCKPDNMKNVVIQGLVTVFLDNPTLGSNVVQFLELISAAETNPNKDFVTKFMRLVELIVTSPNLSKSDVKKLSSTILCYCHQNLYFYKSDGNDDAIDKLCSCVENIVTIHKEYSVLAELTTHLKNGQTKNLEKFSKRLIPFLEALMLNDDNSITNNTRKLIGLLEPKENGRETSMMCATRSLRIMNMTNATPKAIKLGTKAKNFNVNKTSPRGKKEPVLSINEDKSSDYVPIDTKVSLNVDNLNKHQKEVLRRRRDDIPALYEDLTRSQSPDMFKSNDETESRTFDALEEIKEEKSLNSLASELSSLFDREKKIEPTVSPEKTEPRRKTTPKKLRAEIYNAVQKQLEKSHTTEVNQNVVRSIEDNFKVVDESVQNTEDTPVRKSQRVNRRELDFLPTTSKPQIEEETAKAEVSLEDLLARVDKRVEDSRKGDNPEKIPVITIQKFVRSSRTRKNPKPINKPTFKIKLKKRIALLDKKQAKTESPGDVYDFKADQDTPSDKAKNPARKWKRKLCLDHSDYTKKKGKRVAKKQVSHVTAETSPSASSKSPAPVPTSGCPTPVPTRRCPTPTPVTNGRSSRRCPTPVPTNSDSATVSNSKTSCPTPEPINTSPTPLPISADPTPVMNGKSSALRRRCPTPVPNVQSNSPTPDLDNKSPVATVASSNKSSISRRCPTPVSVFDNSVPSTSSTSSNPNPVSTSKSSVVKRRCTTPVPKSKNSVRSQSPTPEPIPVSSSSNPTPVLTSKSSGVRRRCPTPVSICNKSVPSSSNPTPVSTSKSSGVRRRCTTPVPNSKNSVRSKSPTPEPVNKSPTNFSPTSVSTSKSSGVKRRCTTPVPNSKTSVSLISPTPETLDTSPNPETSSNPTPVSGKSSGVRRRCPTQVLNSKTSGPLISPTPETLDTSPNPETSSNPTPVSGKSSGVRRRCPTPVLNSKTSGPLISPTPETLDTSPNPETSSNPTPVTGKSSGVRKRCPTPVPNSKNSVRSKTPTPEPVNTSPTSKRRRCATPVPTVSPISPTPDLPTNTIPTDQSSVLTPPEVNDIKTLSVVITPLDQEQETKENSETQEQLRKNRRKQSFEHVRCSEDVIESSQASQNNHFTRFQSRSRQLKQQTIDEILANREKPDQPNDKLVTMSVLLPNATPKNNERIRRQSLPESNTEPVVRLQRSQSLDTLDQIASDTETVTLEPVITADADTLTLTPVKPDDLPGSPVTCDTPDRTSELLNNTLDISPISSEQEAPPTPAPIPNRRTARLLRMANSNVQIASSDRKWFGKKHASPSVSRVCKMQLSKEERLDILTFSREVPSPLTVPASGILKRKSEDESGAPVAKRKRVNFSDPAITERKIFIRDSEEFEDRNHTTESNTVEEELEEKPEARVLDGEELILSCKDFCDSNFEDTDKGKQALKLLMQNLRVPDIVDVISSPLVDSLVHVIDEQLVTTTKEAQNNTVVKQEITQQQIEEHVVKFNCDNMKNLIDNYVTNLEDDERNRFLVELMCLASNKLPGSKEFVNSHVDILQRFVKRMTE